jgi:hypothetical protein
MLNRRTLFVGTAAAAMIAIPGIEAAASLVSVPRHLDWAYAIMGNEQDRAKGLRRELRGFIEKGVTDVFTVRDNLTGVTFNRLTILNSNNLTHLDEAIWLHDDLVPRARNVFDMDTYLKLFRGGGGNYWPHQHPVANARAHYKRDGVINSDFPVNT